MKFTQPVSMQCSQEKFERDLKEPLEKLGHSIYDLLDFETHPILLTNYDCENKWIRNGIESYKNGNNRHFIDHYNPQLFIALASMSDEPNGIEGEYFVSKERCLPIKLIQKGDCLGVGYGLVRKATKEELINHFTKKEESKVLKTKEILERFEEIGNEFMQSIENYKNYAKELKEQSFIRVDEINYKQNLSTFYYEWEIKGKSNVDLFLDKDNQTLSLGNGKLYFGINPIEHQKMISTYEGRIKELEEKLGKQNVAIVNHLAKLSQIKNIADYPNDERKS